jgi:hypothetical protein
MHFVFEELSVVELVQQQTHSFLCNPKGHYGIRLIRLQVHIVSWMTPVQNL